MVAEISVTPIIIHEAQRADAENPARSSSIQS
jgi:hypothetical protein